MAFQLSGCVWSAHRLNRGALARQLVGSLKWTASDRFPTIWSSVGELHIIRIIMRTAAILCSLAFIAVNASPEEPLTAFPASLQGCWRMESLSDGQHAWVIHRDISFLVVNDDGLVLQGVSRSQLVDSYNFSAVAVDSLGRVYCALVDNRNGRYRVIVTVNELPEPNTMEVLVHKGRQLILKARVFRFSDAASLLAPSVESFDPDLLLASRLEGTLRHTVLREFVDRPPLH